MASFPVGAAGDPRPRMRRWPCPRGRLMSAIGGKADLSITRPDFRF
jgi:hypothetical protein